MKDVADDVVCRFRSWTEKPSAVDPRTLFAPNIVYDKGWGRCLGDEFFSDLKLYTPMQEVTWVAEFVTSDRAALAYNATDPVTLLRHRVVCMLEIHDDQVVSLIEAIAVIPPDVFVQYLKGDATRPMIAGPQVIAHVCNDLGSWGKGFVLAISRRWREPEKAYRSWAAGADPPFGLGEVQLVEVKPLLWVANMVAQHGIRATKAGPPIRYEALRSALEKVADFAVLHNASVHMPRIGCGLAGGDWASVGAIVNETLAVRSVRVFVYDLPSDEGNDGSSSAGRRP